MCFVVLMGLLIRSLDREVPTLGYDSLRAAGSRPAPWVMLRKAHSGLFRCETAAVGVGAWDDAGRVRKQEVLYTSVPEIDYKVQITRGGADIAAARHPASSRAGARTILEVSRRHGRFWCGAARIGSVLTIQKRF